MESLLDQVRGALDGGVVQQAADRLGTSPQQADNAIQAALPLLLGALGRNASSAEGAQSLHRALGDHAGSDPAAVLGQVLGGAGGGDGQAILGHIFGARQPRAAQGVSSASGLDLGNASQLLAMLAPIVMAVLAKRSQGQGLDASALGGLLGQESQRIAGQPGAGGLLNAVLDRDGDGDVDFADISKNVGLLGGLFGKR